MASLLVLHGPNLNLLGTREPDIYGHETLDDINRQLEQQARHAGHHLLSLQSNAEYELIERIHEGGVIADSYFCRSFYSGLSVS